MRVGRVLDDAAAHHGGQPFPDVALVEAGLLGDLGAGDSPDLRHRVEQPDPPADLEHEGDGGAFEVANHELSERSGLRPVELARHRRPLLTDCRYTAR